MRRQWQLAAPCLAALAPVGVEDAAGFDTDVASPERKDLGSPATGEHQSQDDRTVPQTHWRLRDACQQAPDLFGAKPTRRRLFRAGPLQLVAWIRPEQFHAHQEAEVAAKAGDA